MTRSVVVSPLRVPPHAFGALQGLLGGCGHVWRRARPTNKAGSISSRPLALGALVKLDVLGCPLTRRWHLLDPQGKRQSAAAQAFKTWLFEHRP
jgi:hypothetical protein